MRPLMLGALGTPHTYEEDRSSREALGSQALSPMRRNWRIDLKRPESPELPRAGGHGAQADLQAQRVAKARGVSPDAVRQLIQDNTHGRWLGLFGEPGVNVLKLNLALDSLH